MLCFREQTEAAANAMQADPTNAVPAVARRATADMATQYMLGDLDSEPVTAHARELHSAHAANVRGPVNHSSVESAEVLGAASAAQHRHASHGLIQAHDHPIRGADRPSRQAESGMLTKHANPVVHHSDLEGAVTEDEASLKQAEVTALLGIDRPHPVSWDQSSRLARKHQQTAGSHQAKNSVSADDVSILVTAGSQEYAPSGNPASWTDMHKGKASSRHAGSGGTAPRAATGPAGGQSPYDIRSPLQSTHEEHAMRSRSLRPSSTGEYYLDSYGQVAPDCCTVSQHCDHS